MKHTPRKRFGQHFLVDASVIDAIVRAIAPRESDRIVEIGPGTGVLTEALLERTGRIEAVEIDRDLARRLRERWPATRLCLHEADALTFDFAALVGPSDPRPLRLVGNLPYNISSPLLVALLAVRAVVVDQHFMLQKEVVERIVAGPGSAAYGRLGVLLQAFHDVEALFDVPPEAFDPPPRVDSAVIRMLPKASPGLADPAPLESVLAAAFGQRRKMLRNTLAPWLDAQRLDWPAGFPPTARAEEIPVDAWVALAAQAAARRDSISSIL